MTLGTQSAPQGKLLDYEQFIDHQLERTRSRIKMTDVITACLTLFAAVLGLLFVEIVLDHLFGLPVWFRQITLLSAISGFAAYTAFRVVIPVARRVNSIYAAKTIENADPAFKNSLINYLELRQNRDKLPKAVLAALESRAVTDLTHVNVDTTVNQHHLMNAVYAVMAVIVIFCLYIAFAPKSILDSTQRAFLADVARPTNTRLVNIKPGENIELIEKVAGENAAFSVDVLGNRPKSVLLHYSVDGGKFYAIRDFGAGKNMYDPWQVTLPNVQQDIEYYITAGDAESPHFKLTVRPAPTITSITLDLDFPEYTRTERRANIDGGYVEAVEGTKVTVHARTNMPARAATVNVTHEPAVPMEISKDDPQSLKGVFQANNSGTYTIFFRTTGGLLNPNPVVYDIKIIKDRAPTAHFLSPNKPTISMPANTKFDLMMTGNDDHGIKDATLHIHLGNETLVSRNLLDGMKPMPTFRSTHTLDASAFKLKAGDTLEYWLKVRDDKEPTANPYETARQIIKITEPLTEAQKKKFDQNQKEERQQLEKSTAPDEGTADNPADQVASTDPKDGGGDAGKQTGNDQGKADNQGNAQQGNPQQDRGAAENAGDPGAQDQGAAEPQNNKPGDDQQKLDRVQKALRDMGKLNPRDQTTPKSGNGTPTAGQSGGGGGKPTNGTEGNNSPYIDQPQNPSNPDKNPQPPTKPGMTAPPRNQTPQQGNDPQSKPDSMPANDPSNQVAPGVQNDANQQKGDNTAKEDQASKPGAGQQQQQPSGNADQTKGGDQSAPKSGDQSQRGGTKPGKPGAEPDPSGPASTDADPSVSTENKSPQTNRQRPSFNRPANNQRTNNTQPGGSDPSSPQSPNMRQKGTTPSGSSKTQKQTTKPSSEPESGDETKDATKKKTFGPSTTKPEQNPYYDTKDGKLSKPSSKEMGEKASSNPDQQTPKQPSTKGAGTNPNDPQSKPDDATPKPDPNAPTPKTGDKPNPAGKPGSTESAESKNPNEPGSPNADQKPGEGKNGDRKNGEGNPGENTDNSQKLPPGPPRMGNLPSGADRPDMSPPKPGTPIGPQNPAKLPISPPGTGNPDNSAKPNDDKNSDTGAKGNKPDGAAQPRDAKEPSGESGSPDADQKPDDAKAGTAGNSASGTKGDKQNGAGNKPDMNDKPGPGAPKDPNQPQPNDNTQSGDPTQDPQNQKPGMPANPKAGDNKSSKQPGDPTANNENRPSKPGTNSGDASEPASAPKNPSDPNAKPKNAPGNKGNEDQSPSNTPGDTKPGGQPSNAEENQKPGNQPGGNDDSAQPGNKPKAGGMPRAGQQEPGDEPGGNKVKPQVSQRNKNDAARPATDKEKADAQAEAAARDGDPAKRPTMDNPKNSSPPLDPSLPQDAKPNDPKADADAADTKMPQNRTDQTVQQKSPKPQGNDPNSTQRGADTQKQAQPSGDGTQSTDPSQPGNNPGDSQKLPPGPPKMGNLPSGADRPDMSLPKPGTKIGPPNPAKLPISPPGTGTPDKNGEAGDSGKPEPAPEGTEKSDSGATPKGSGEAKPGSQPANEPSDSGAPSKPGEAGQPSDSQSAPSGGSKPMNSNTPGTESGAKPTGKPGSAPAQTGKPGQPSGAKPQGKGDQPGGQPDPTNQQPGERAGGAQAPRAGGSGDASGKAGANNPGTEPPAPFVPEPENRFNDSVAPEGIPQSDLVLRKLEDALKDVQSAHELESRTGLSRETLEQLATKFKGRNHNPAGPGREITIKPGDQQNDVQPSSNLPGLNPNARMRSTTTRGDGTVIQDNVRENLQGIRLEPPPEWRGKWEGYKSRLARSKNSTSTKKSATKP